MPLSKVLTLFSLAASAVAATQSQKTGAFKLDRALKRKLAKASKPSLNHKKLVDEDDSFLDEFATCDEAQASEHWAHACSTHAETACADLFQAYHECEWEFNLATHLDLDCDMTCAGVAAPEEHHDDHDGHDHGDAVPEESDGAAKIGAAAASALAAAFAFL